MKKVGLFLALSLCTFSFGQHTPEIKNKNFELGLSHQFLIGQANKYNNSLNLGIDAVLWTDIRENTTRSKTKKNYRLTTNSIYGFPLVGLYANSIIGLNEEIGTPITLGITTDITFLQKEHHLFSLRPRLGASYFTNSFDAVTNPSNALIGSKLNINTQLGIYYTNQTKKSLTNGLSYKAGINIVYYTNGSIKKPASSLALINATIALQLGPKLLPYFKSERAEFKKSFFTQEQKRMSYFIQTGMLLKQISPDSKNYFGSRIALGVNKPVNMFMSISAHALHVYDPSIPDELNQVALENNNRIGLASGASLKYHRLSFNPTVGIYVYKPENSLDNRIFHNYKVGLELTQNLYTYSNMIVHSSEIDSLELGIGLKI